MHGACTFWVCARLAPGILCLVLDARRVRILLPSLQCSAGTLCRRCAAARLYVNVAQAAPALDWAPSTMHSVSMKALSRSYKSFASLLAERSLI